MNLACKICANPIKLEKKMGKLRFCSKKRVTHKLFFVINVKNICFYASEASQKWLCASVCVKANVVLDLRIDLLLLPLNL